MRIISGTFKGKRILDPKDNKTRPLKDLTKESIFNILAHSKKIKFKIEDSNILDLFSGVGSFGIECLSRGAKHVTFVENYDEVLPILKKNLLNCKRCDKPCSDCNADGTLLGQNHAKIWKQLYKIQK